MSETVRAKKAWARRGATRVGALLAALSLSPSPVLAQQQPSGAAEQASASEPEPEPETLTELRASGTEAYGQEKYEEAEALFAKALKLVPVEEKVLRANLTFTLASCAFENGRFSESQARFEQAARLSRALRAEALVHGGFAAFQAGKVEQALRLLRESQAEGRASEEVRELQEELADWLRLNAEEVEERRFVEKWHRADAALKAADFELSRRLYLELLEEKNRAGDQERAYFHRGLAIVAMWRGDAAEEEARLTLAYQLDPSPLDLLERAEARRAQGNTTGADEDFQLAGESCEEPETCASAKEGREALRLLPAAGLGGSLGLAWGYDTNAAQSGAADAVGVTTLNDSTASPYASFNASLQYLFRPNLNWTLGPAYSGAFVAFTQAAVSELSLQRHAGTFKAAHAPSIDSRIALETGAAFTWVGLNPISPFTLEGLISLEGTKRWPSARARAFQLSVLADARFLQGGSDFEYMDGFAGEARSRALWIRGAWQAGTWLSFRYYGIGSIDYEITADELFECGSDVPDRACEDLSRLPMNYHIPLGYWAPTWGGEWSWAASRAWGFAAQAQLEYRQYLEESYAESLDAQMPPPFALGLEVATQKRRMDFRPRVGLSITRSFGEEQNLSASLRYDALLSVSNMERVDSEGVEPVPGVPPAPNYDYDNRNFFQQAVEVRVDFRF